MHQAGSHPWAFVSLRIGAIVCFYIFATLSMYSTFYDKHAENNAAMFGQIIVIKNYRCLEFLSRQEIETKAGVCLARFATTSVILKVIFLVMSGSMTWYAEAAILWRSGYVEYVHRLFPADNPPNMIQNASGWIPAYGNLVY